MTERLIDAEAFGELLINRMNTIAKEQLERCPADVGIAMGVVLGIKDLLDSQPTIDATPVVHAHWKECWDYNCDNYSYCCSNCGKDALTKEGTMYDQVLTEFCPYCGAQMDEKESD